MDKNRRRIRIGYIQWLLIYTYICTIFSFTCEAANAQDRTGNEEYVLILNSYNESSPWSNSITTPIVHKLAWNQKYRRLHRTSEFIHGRRFLLK